MLTKIYADAPDYRLLTELVDELRRGAIFIYPTASGYAYCCDALHQRAIEELCRLKKIDSKKKALSIACASLSKVSEYCKMNDRAFKFIKEHEVNYTFILPASGALPRIFKQRKEVGVRLTQHPIGRLLAEHLGNPLIMVILSIPFSMQVKFLWLRQRSLTAPKSLLRSCAMVMVAWLTKNPYSRKIKYTTIEHLW